MQSSTTIKTLSNLPNELKLEPTSSLEEVFNHIDKIKTINQWNSLVSNFKVNSDHPKWSNLMDKLNEILSEPSLKSFQFAGVLHNLDVTQSEAIWKNPIISKKLSLSIKTSSDLNTILRYLSLEQCIQFCRTSFTDNIIKSAHDFRWLLSDLSSEKTKKICHIFYEDLMRVIKKPEDFDNLIGEGAGRLHYDQMTEVCESPAIRNRLLKIIKKGEDFCFILGNLKSLHREKIFKLLKYNLMEYVEDAFDVNRILCRLDREQQSEFYRDPYMQKKLPALIHTAKDLGEVLTFLDSDQCKELCESRLIQEKLPTIIKTADDFIVLYSSLLDGRKHFLEIKSIVDILLKIICTADDLKKIFASFFMHINPEDFCKTKIIQDKLLEIIKTKDDLNIILSGLPTDYREDSIWQALCQTKAIQDKALEVFDTAEDLNKVLRHQNPEQYAALFESKKIPIFIQTMNNFNSLLYGLSQDQRTAILESKSICVRVAEIIKPNDFIGLFCRLDILKKIPPLYESLLKKLLPEVINTAEGFQKLLQFLQAYFYKVKQISPLIFLSDLMKDSYPPSELVKLISQWNPVICNEIVNSLTYNRVSEGLFNTQPLLISHLIFVLAVKAENHDIISKYSLEKMPPEIQAYADQMVKSRSYCHIL